MDLILVGRAGLVFYLRFIIENFSNPVPLIIQLFKLLKEESPVDHNRIFRLLLFYADLTEEIPIVLAYEIVEDN